MASLFMKSFSNNNNSHVVVLGRLCVVAIVVFVSSVQAATVPLSSTTKAFYRDVVRANKQIRNNNKNNNLQNELNDELLAKAIPIAEYESRKVDVQGNKIIIGESKTASRWLEEENREDDFYVNYDNMYSFSGYSMKYAKCQPVQYFSEDAILAGEHSPMITEDIVILRLCPSKSCEESAQYGCHYNYAEYALSLADYLTVMLKYDAKKRDALCEWCEDCGVEFYEEEEEEEAAEEEEEEEAAEEEEQDDDAVQEEQQQEAQAAQQDNYDEEEAEDVAEEEDDGERRRRRRRKLEDYDDNDDYFNGNYYDNYDDDGNNNADYYYNNNNYNDGCYNVDTYCADFNTICGEDDDGYLDYEEIVDYLNCNEVKYNDYAYFVRPRCDGYEGTIKMAVYYDNYCVQYAGSDVSVKNLGLGFHEGQFSAYYAGSCIDCSESEQAPYFDVNSALCNKLHSTSAKCTSDLLYDLFDNENNDGSSSSTKSSTECSYIESIRFGTYDETGKLSSVTNGVQWSTEVSTGQKIMLSISIFFCVCFVIYSCYLHHAMTNLLIKSLSHRELLPPSRHRLNNRRRNSSGRSAGSGDELEKPGIV